MRKSFYHILLLGALTLGTTSSCDDYLEVDHYDILPEDFMYRNEANIKSGLYGIYDTFYTYQGSDNSGDDTTWGFKPNVNPEKPDVPLNKNDAFQKVQKRRVQEKR